MKRQHMAEVGMWQEARGRRAAPCHAARDRAGSPPTSRVTPVFQVSKEGLDRMMERREGCGAVRSMWIDVSKEVERFVCAPCGAIAEERGKVWNSPPSDDDIFALLL